jgi:DNA-binding beta-propeller fold protein YncE
MKKWLLPLAVIFLVIAVTADLFFTFVPAGELVVVNQWGKRGGGPGEFNEPIGITVGPAGNIYVADVRNSRVQKFSPGGNFILQWGKKGSGEGQFEKPVGVAVDAEGKVYVSDYDLDRIQVFSPNGAFLAQWEVTGKGEVTVAAGIGIDRNTGAIYLAEFYGKRVEKFTPDGKFIAQVGRPGRVMGGALHYPTDVHLDQKGGVYVADAYNNRIQKFDKNGVFRAKWGGPFGLGIPGGWRGWFRVPSGVAVDGGGRIYVADSANQRVVVMSAEGRFLAQWKTGQESVLFSPTRVAVGKDGTIYAVDTARDRIVALNYRPPRN